VLTAQTCAVPFRVAPNRAIVDNVPALDQPEEFYEARPKMCRYAAMVFAGLLSLGPTLVPAQVPVPANRKSNGGLKPPAEKELIYVALPGTLEGSWDQNGSGIVVLDASNNFSFVNAFRPGTFRELVPRASGRNRAAPSLRWCMSPRRPLAPGTDDGAVRPGKTFMTAIAASGPRSRDGSFMYVGSDLKDFWYVVNPTTGALITKVRSPDSLTRTT